MKNIKLWTAVVTPLDEKGKIDFDSLKHLLKVQERALNGIILLGSTGEGMALSRAEKESVIIFAETCNLKVPCLAGVPGHQLEEALSWIRFCKLHRIQGFLSVTPYYSKPGVQGQIDWFQAILDEAKLPVMLYNVPSRTGVRLAPQALQALKRNPYFWALKESSGSLESFQEYQSLNSEIDYFCGDDGLMPDFALAGAKGLISVVSNVWPEATLKMVELSLAGKAQEWKTFWTSCTDSLFLASNPIPVKWLLKERGWIKTATLRAPLSLNDLIQEFALTQRIKEADQQVQAWLTKQEQL